MNYKIKILIIISIPIIFVLSLYVFFYDIQNMAITKTETSTSILINTSIVSITSTVTQSSDESLSINLVTIQDNKAASWSKTDFTILIFPNNSSNDQQNLELIGVVKDSINQWEKSILEFTDNYRQYSYLSQINFILYTAGINDSLLQGKSDIKINFVENIPSSLIGETNLLISDFNRINNANITVSTQNLTLIGIQNVITHEFGHVFGLAHSSTDIDLMYFEREKDEVKENYLCPSTLNIFALALLYHWIETPLYHPFYTTTVSLPDSISYDILNCESA